MAAFINEYVVQRAIPIPKLLYAFGVCLVSDTVILTIPDRHRTSDEHSATAVQAAPFEAAPDAHLLPARGAFARVRVLPAFPCAFAHPQPPSHNHHIPHVAQIGIARAAVDVQHDRRRGQSDQGVKTNPNTHRRRNQSVLFPLLSAV